MLFGEFFFFLLILLSFFDAFPTGLKESPVQCVKVKPVLSQIYVEQTLKAWEFLLSGITDVDMLVGAADVGVVVFWVFNILCKKLASFGRVAMQTFVDYLAGGVAVGGVFVCLFPVAFAVPEGAGRDGCLFYWSGGDSFCLLCRFFCLSLHCIL